MSRRITWLFGTALATMVAPLPSAAHAGESEKVAPLAAPEETSDGKDSRVFTPEDFTQFAPHNALDMLSRVPGFTIREGEQERGLGQASDNVLVNGQRLSGKSEGLYDQIARIPLENVVRIEIVDGATLDIPGLSGQVANIVTRTGGLTGQYEWRTRFRPHYAHPQWLAGEVSISGSTDRLEYNASLSNNDGRGALGGSTYITGPDGDERERRDGALRIKFDGPKLAGGLKWKAPGEVVVELNGSYRRSYFTLTDEEERFRQGDLYAQRDYLSKSRGFDYEFGANISFPLGGGTFKLTGLERFEHESAENSVLYQYAAALPDEGSRFALHTDSGERIARGEYGWKMLGGDWQIAGEAAFNRLTREAALSELLPDGSYADIPFPAAAGGVREDRYEVILTHGRTLAPGLSVQLGGGGEFSRMTQDGPGGLAREFWRPKGSFSLAWKVDGKTDISVKLARTVGQLSFGDFLANVFLNDDTDKQNDGNANLVPQQAWEAELEFKRDFGKFGSGSLRLFHHWVQDYVDVIPLADGGESPGNVPRATYYGAQWNSTFKLAPLGLKGVELEVNATIEGSRMRDPLTGILRPVSWHSDRSAEIALRHDIPNTEIAWGVGMQYSHNQPYYRLNEVGREYEGPVYAWVFIEHKDVYGLKLRLDVFNINNGRGIFYRTVYDGPRDTAPVLFRESRDALIGPIFSFSVSGTF